MGFAPRPQENFPGGECSSRAWGLPVLNIRENFRGSAARARGVCPVTVAGVGFPTPSGAARVRVGFASVHDDVSEIGHLVQLARVGGCS